MKTVQTQTTGKRKRATARATLMAGTGIIRINKISIDNYEPRYYRMKIMEPLMLASDLIDKVDISVTVKGGGIASQSEAVRLAIAKSLVEHAKTDKLKEAFLNYDRNLLVADVRRKEPAKPNRHGQARAKKQKSYR